MDFIRGEKIKVYGSEVTVMPLLCVSLVSFLYSLIGVGRNYFEFEGIIIIVLCLMVLVELDGINFFSCVN